MSISEPRLTFGEGQPEARATTVVPSDGASAKSNPSEAHPAQFLASSSPADSLHVDSEPPSFNCPQPAKKRTADDDHGALPPLVTFGDLILEAPAWLFSAALHMLAVIILGVLFIVPERPIELLLSMDNGDGFEELNGTEFDLDLDVSEESADTAFDSQELVTLEDPVLIEPVEINPMVLDSDSMVVSAPIQMALTGRSHGMQERLLDAYGGSGETQRSVMNALQWLRRHQSSRGMWSLTGNYRDGAKVENREAATGLALIAFQGAGYTPHGDPQHDFTKVTAKAWRSLLRQQGEDGSFFHNGSGNSQLYTQAICTIALCELYGMTQDSHYHEPAQRAVDFCLRAQSPEGGWRYFPGSGNDLSVTGWFVMALQSARMAGLDVPSPALKRINGYLNSVEHKNGAAYSYQSHGSSAATASMTAEGLLCRQYLGWSQTDKRLQRGADSLLRNLPTWTKGERDVYYWYYATQVCHHMEGKHWRTWNDTMKTVIPRHQVREGRDRGSWDPNGDQWGSEGGRLYVTCLSTYMLEVYYRHLPIYKMDLLHGGSP